MIDIVAAPWDESMGKIFKRDQVIRFSIIRHPKVIIPLVSSCFISHFLQIIFYFIDIYISLLSQMETRSSLQHHSALLKTRNKCG